LVVAIGIAAIASIAGVMHLRSSRLFSE